MKIWDRVGIKLTTPGSAIVFATNCVTGPSIKIILLLMENASEFSKILSEVLSDIVSNSLDPDMALHFIWPDLGLICLQRIIKAETTKEYTCHYHCGESVKRTPSKA